MERKEKREMLDGAKWCLATIIILAAVLLIAVSVN
jgi:hypothetical protein